MKFSWIEFKKKLKGNFRITKRGKKYIEREEIKKYLFYLLQR